MRKRSISVTWTIIAVLTGLVLLSYGIAAILASLRIREIEWLSSLPCADIHDNNEGPARYAGRLYGPEGRITPFGEKVAAYWWTVSSSDGDVGYDVKCHDEVRSGLFLVTRQGSIPIAWADAAPDDVGLASSYDRGEYGRPFAIDIGDAPAVLYDTIPPGICNYGENYLQTYIAQGIRAEVVGCIRNGAIDRCDALLGGVLSVPDIRSDMRHRMWSARRGLWIATLLVLWMLGISTLALWKWAGYTNKNAVSLKEVAQ